MATQVSTGDSGTSGVGAFVDLTDAQLIARLTGGGDWALAEVYQRHATRVIAVANAVLGDRTAAEDVCHDVFVALALRPQEFDGERASLRTYLVVAAHGRALDRRRADQARARREERQARFGSRTSPGPDNEASSMAGQRWAAVSALPVPEADVLRLAFFGGSTYREVACMLDVAEGTVKSRIRSGLRRLRGAFVEQGIITPA